MAPLDVGAELWLGVHALYLNVEVTGYFTAFDDRSYNRHLSLTMLTLSHIDFKDFSQHFAPTRVFPDFDS